MLKKIVFSAAFVILVNAGLISTAFGNVTLKCPNVVSDSTTSGDNGIQLKESKEVPDGANNDDGSIGGAERGGSLVAETKNPITQESIKWSGSTVSNYKPIKYLSNQIDKTSNGYILACRYLLSDETCKTYMSAEVNSSDEIILEKPDVDIDPSHTD